jgi:hypothetical protein
MPVHLWNRMCAGPAGEKQMMTGLAKEEEGLRNGPNRASSIPTNLRPSLAIDVPNKALVQGFSTSLRHPGGEEGDVTDKNKGGPQGTAPRHQRTQ